MQLDMFFDYKNQLMNDLLTNNTISQLLTDDGSIPTAPEELVYRQVFPYEYIPETVEHGQTFICCDVDVQRSINKTFLMPVLYVWVFTHKSKLKLPTGGVRIDKLVSEVAYALNGSRYYGLGELDLFSIKRFTPIADYQGKVMTFYTTEYNRPSPSNKPIPSNRKRD